MKRGSTLESPDCNLINVENKKRRIVLQSHRGTPLWHRDEEGKPDCLAEFFFFQRLSIMSQEPRCRSETTPSRSLDQRVNQDSLNTLYILIANGIDDAYPKINALAELTRFADDAAPPPRPWHRVRQLHWAHHRLLTRLHTNLKRPLRPSSCRPPS